MNEQLNKASIIRQMQIERSHFETTLEQLNEVQIIDEPIIDEWTAKDIVVHITAWERELLRWLDSAAQGQRPAIPDPGAWSDYVERFNVQVYTENRNRSLLDVMAESHQVYSNLLLELGKLPEDPDDSLWSVWLDEQPPWGLIASYYEHYQEHGQQIEVWLKRF
jgi:hypothetical protein